MTLLIAIQGAGENWDAESWRQRFAARLPDRSIAVWPAMPADPAEIRYAAVWRPPEGVLASLPNLEVIFNLGAGVDALLQSKALPTSIPIVRVVTEDLTKRMTEYVALHVLLYHRRQREMDAAQAREEWWPKAQWAASAVRVGIMGVGEIGSDAAAVLTRIGFRVAGWSRTMRTLDGVETFAGAEELPAFLARTDILVALIPLTDETRGILNYRLFSALARDGVLGAPVLINAGRGGLQVEEDIIRALDDGTLGGATLDVFATEPLPPGHPLWHHPKVVVTPHNAADSDPEAISDYIVRQLHAFERGEGLSNVVDRLRGY